MNRSEAIALLRGGGDGIKTWNRWRKLGHEVPDLSLANFEDSLEDRHISIGADVRASEPWPGLFGGNLTEVDLSGVALVGANFRGVDLSQANLSKADLRKAKLSYVSLRGANLSAANLTDADFDNSAINKANFTGAILENSRLTIHMASGADFSHAILRNIILTSKHQSDRNQSFIDLATARGLETADFGNPEFLSDYINQVHDYIHQGSSDYDTTIEDALSSVKLLRRFLQSGAPSQILIESIRELSAEMVKYLAKHPGELHNIRPRQFEELIAEILTSFGWRVELTKTTRDGGYDLFAISREELSGAETSWLIECKKFAPERKVGIDIVRALHGVKVDLRVANMMLATTSHFSRDAHSYKASRYDLALRDYEGIVEWLNTYVPNPDGKLYFKGNRLISSRDE